jgi:uncharacterized protein YbjT (DUF2867 family)
LAAATNGVEGLIACSGVPYTILRATQFHDPVDRVLRTERFLPVLVAPAFTLETGEPGWSAALVVVLALSVAFPLSALLGVRKVT